MIWAATIHCRNSRSGVSRNSPKSDRGQSPQGQKRRQNHRLRNQERRLRPGESQFVQRRHFLKQLDYQ
jgi:hypothetical protein